MVIFPLALSWDDIFSPLVAGAKYVLQGLMNFTSWIKCLLFENFYHVATITLDVFPSDWRTTINSGLEGASSVFKFADIFLPMTFVFSLMGFLVAFSISFWVFRFICRLEILGFKLGG